MPQIELNTLVKADKAVVFDLSRSIDLHIISTNHTNEKAVAGKTSGLIGLNETVTWQAKHFGVTQRLTTKITEYRYPDYFVDEMVRGIFQTMRHEHFFTKTANGTLMKDVFYYKSPLGGLGIMVDKLFLVNYMKNLLINRNQIIKKYAETGMWKNLFS